MVPWWTLLIALAVAPTMLRITLGIAKARRRAPRPRGRRGLVRGTYSMAGSSGRRIANDFSVEVELLERQGGLVRLRYLDRTVSGIPRWDPFFYSEATGKLFQEWVEETKVTWLEPELSDVA